MVITYPRTCELCNHTYSTSPNFFRHKREHCEKFRQSVVQSSTPPQTQAQTIIYQINVTNVLNYNVFPGDPDAANKALFGDINGKQRKQITSVTEILQQDGIEGLKKTAEFIQTSFPTIDEVKALIDECDENVIAVSLNIDAQKKERFDHWKEEVSNARSKGKPEKIKKAEVKFDAVMDELLESAIYDFFRRMILNRATDSSLTSTKLAASPPLFVNIQGDTRAWCSTKDDGRKWLRKSENKWQEIADMIAARIVSITATLNARYKDRKKMGLEFSAKLVKKMRKDVESFCRTETANGWYILSDRCKPPEEIQKLLDNTAGNVEVIQPIG